MIKDGLVNSRPASLAAQERGDAWRRSLLVAASSLVAAMYVSQAFAIITGSRAWLVQRLPDDAYYYLQVGSQIARGHGATFDGIHQTNGFHPLWQLVIAGTALVASGDALVRTVMLLALFLSLGGALLWGWSVARLLGPAAAALGLLLVLVIVPAGGSQVDGMEGALVVASLGLLTVILIRFDERRRLLDAMILGLACALGVLSRLDLVVVLWLIGPILLVRTRSLRLSAAWAAAFVIGIAPYFAWNELTFGHFLSVSGTLKLASMHSLTQALGGYLSLQHAAFTGRISSATCFRFFGWTPAESFGCWLRSRTWCSASSPSTESVLGSGDFWS